VTSPPREKTQENVKRKKNHANNPCTLPTKKQIEKKLRVIVLRLRVRIGVRDNRCRHVRRRGLGQSLKSQSVMQVCGRKARGFENLLRLDTAAFKEVTKEGRDVSGLEAREVLVARDVLHGTLILPRAAAAAADACQLHAAPLLLALLCSLLLALLCSLSGSSIWELAKTVLLAT
jgi:hypothetical protein